MEHTTVSELSQISSKDASSVTGYTTAYINTLARGGKITGSKVNRRWHLDRSSVLNFQKRHRSGRVVTPVVRDAAHEPHAQAVAYQTVPLISTDLYQSSGGVLSQERHQLFTQGVALTLACLIVASSAFVAHAPAFSRTLGYVGEWSDQIAIGLSDTLASSAAQAVFIIGVTANELQGGAFTVGASIDHYVNNVRSVQTAALESVSSIVLSDALYGRLLSLAGWSVQAFEAYRADIDAMNYALGNGVIRATHAAINLDVSLAYWLAAAAPASANFTVTTLVMVGDSVARATAQVPRVAVASLFTLAEAPSRYAPRVAATVWGAAFASADYAHVSQMASVFALNSQ